MSVALAYVVMVDDLARGRDITALAAILLEAFGGPMVNRTIDAMRTHSPFADAGVVDKAVEPGWCEFRIRGRLGRSLIGAFPSLRAEVDGSETVLTGPLPDQAAVHGVLAQIEALGLELLEFRRLDR